MGDGVQACTREVGDNVEIRIGASTVRVLSTPCHTSGHVCYVVDGHVFTGDTLFISGAGNFNSGTSTQMLAAFDKLMALPDETKVWVGHEYTCRNCEFAVYCEPSNAAAGARLAWARTRRSMHAGGEGTIPSTIGAEKACNPFARVDSDAIKTFVGAADRVS